MATKSLPIDNYLEISQLPLLTQLKQAVERIDGGI